MPHKDPAAAKAYWKAHYWKNRDAQLAAAKAWVGKNRERANEQSRKWRAANPEKRKQVARDSYHRHSAKRNAYRRLKRTGATPEMYAALMVDQKNLCAICGGPPGKRVLQTDHCHKTKKVRGLLCFRCNPAIGLFRDDIALLQKAIDYLRAHE